MRGRARASGLACRDDLSVIGFDNIPESALAEPPLTTIDQSIQQMGFEAVQLLIRLIDGAAVPTRRTSRCRRGSWSRQSCRASPVTR